MTTLTNDEYNILKDLAATLCEDREKMALYPTLYNQYQSWINLLYKILKENRSFF